MASEDEANTRQFLTTIAKTKRKRLGVGAALLQLVGLLAIALLINALFGPKPLWA